MRKRTQLGGTVLALTIISLSALLAGSPATPSSWPDPVSPALRQELLTAREAVWRAWFANDQQKLRQVIAEEIIAINPGDVAWQDKAAVLADARSFAQNGGQLLRLEFPHTEIQLYGDMAILYTRYLYEYEVADPPTRETIAGRGTEIFVRRNGIWVNSGWHLDSGR